MAARRDEALAGQPTVSHLAGLAGRVAVALLLSLVALLLTLRIELHPAFAVSSTGSEFQVNTNTAYNQVDPRVASDSAGNFVVVWSSNYGESIQGQRYDSSGAALGGQFQVNTYTPDLQESPAIASDSAGNFVVVWQGDGSAGTDTSGLSVQGQRFAANGSPNGGQFQINTYTTGFQEHPSIASDSAGNFVVVWQSAGSAGSDTSDTSVQGQRYGANGSAIGGEFQVNTYTTLDQSAPSVASDSAGNFVVVWQSTGSAGSDTSGLSVQGRRYDASGSAIGGEFQVNTYTAGFQLVPSVARAAAGAFAVVWNSFGSAGSDTSGWSVQGQRYDASGSAIGGQFQVNSYTTASQSYPSVASDSAGDFIVVWYSEGSAGSDTDRFSVQGQTYSASGSAIGGQFQVNTYTTSYQAVPSVASNSAGSKFVVAWQSDGSSGSDTSSYSVQGQRYLPEPSFMQSVVAMLPMLIMLGRARSRPRSAGRPAGAGGGRTRAA